MKIEKNTECLTYNENEEENCKILLIIDNLEEIIKNKDEVIKLNEELLQNKDKIIEILKREIKITASMVLAIIPFKTFEEYKEALETDKGYTFMQIMRYWQDKINEKTDDANA